MVLVLIIHSIVFTYDALVRLKRRHDLVSNLLETMKAHVANEKVRWRHSSLPVIGPYRFGAPPVPSSSLTKPPSAGCRPCASMAGAGNGDAVGGPDFCGSGPR
ncbi:hypothetical protein MCA2073 [Methylococcus capsulatus str. Bath]|uniref:Uncharacterized protein n=1 Tax=Methylococcus capsulatus (strain ATCC 33009 / NCIMB 11132 / Bath) TaxID=243233 RepID=Q606E5_METCA|nr:hypothetical protein MCA2073 [Methylococcus capsulatus str. Bath]